MTVENNPRELGFGLTASASLRVACLAARFLLGTLGYASCLVSAGFIVLA